MDPAAVLWLKGNQTEGDIRGPYEEEAGKNRKENNNASVVHSISRPNGMLKIGV